MDDVIITAAEFSSARPKKDGSWTLSFSTTIPSPSEKHKFVDFFGKYGILAFIDKEELSEEDERAINELREVDGILSGKKTPSQRLRAVLYIMHKNEGGDTPFQVYYEQWMEKIIQHFKTKLPSDGPTD